MPPPPRDAVLQCRECRATGGALELNGSFAVNGQTLGSMPLLPRCACFIRLHKGRLPQAVMRTLSSVPDVAELANVTARERGEAAGAHPDDAISENMRRRHIFSVDGLPTTRMLPVYAAGKPSMSQLGSIVLTAEHKLSDVLRLLTDELGVEASARVSRGTAGERLTIPLHKRQHGRPAMHFFPSEHHFVVVEDAGK